MIKYYRSDDVPSNLRYNKFAFNNVLSNNNNRMIVFASILGAILATSILTLNPSTITNAQAMPYGSGDYDDRSIFLW